MVASRPYNCGLDAAADVIGGKWKPQILWELHHGPRRFGELRKAIPGVTEKMLIQQLRELESRNIVRREVYQQVPPKVEYSLTTLGESLQLALAPLDDWGGQHLAELETTRPPLLPLLRPPPHRITPTAPPVDTRNRGDPRIWWVARRSNPG